MTQKKKRNKVVVLFELLKYSESIGTYIQQSSLSPRVTAQEVFPGGSSRPLDLHFPAQDGPLLAVTLSTLSTLGVAYVPLKSYQHLGSNLPPAG